MGLQSTESGVKRRDTRRCGRPQITGWGQGNTVIWASAKQIGSRPAAQVGRRPLLEDSCMLIKELERALKSGKPPRLENSRAVVKFCGIGIGGEYSNGTLKWLWQPEAWAETHSAVPDTLSHTM